MQVLQLGDTLTISGVAATLFPSLLYGHAPSFETIMDWIQAPFTARTDESFPAGTIHTRRELELEPVAPMTLQDQEVIDHALHQFPGRYPPIRQDKEGTARGEKFPEGGLLSVGRVSGEEEGVGEDSTSATEEVSDGPNRFGRPAGSPRHNGGHRTDVKEDEASNSAACVPPRQMFEGY